MKKISIFLAFLLVGCGSEMQTFRTFSGMEGNEGELCLYENGENVACKKTSMTKIMRMIGSMNDHMASIPTIGEETYAIDTKYGKFLIEPSGITSQINEQKKLVKTLDYGDDFYLAVKKAYEQKEK